MKHYRDPSTNQIYAYEADGSQDPIIAPTFILLTDVALAALRAQQTAETPEERLVAYKAFIQRLLDAQAQAYGYDSIAAAVTYADEPAVPKFQAEGQALRAWRSLVWARGYELLEEVEAGTMPEPSAEELPALLPAYQGAA